MCCVHVCVCVCVPQIIRLHSHYHSPSSSPIPNCPAMSPPPPQGDDNITGGPSVHECTEDPCFSREHSRDHTHPKDCRGQPVRKAGRRGSVKDDKGEGVCASLAVSVLRVCVSVSVCVLVCLCLSVGVYVSVLVPNLSSYDDQCIRQVMEWCRIQVVCNEWLVKKLWLAGVGLIEMLAYL